MIFVQLGCGENHLAAERILAVVVRECFPLPATLLTTLTNWLDLYVGTREERRLRAFIARIGPHATLLDTEADRPMTQSGETFPAAQRFDKLYRGDPSLDGGAKPIGIRWDIHQPQPQLMELEALGGIAGEVLDIGCGLGDNSIFLASRGYSVTGLDSSPAAIEQASSRAADAGATVTFGVADATNLTGYDERFDTVIDSALYHCLDQDGRQAYAAGLYRATRPGARWHLYCFSDGNINGMTAPMGAAPEVAEAMLQGLGTIAQNIRDTLTATGWLINYFGPTTYLGNISAFIRDVDDLPEQQRAKVSPGALEQMRGINNRFATIVNLIDNGRVYLPFTVVHADRVD